MITNPFPRQRQLRRYKTPQYPRAMDASPIDISDPSSYPLRQSKLKPALGFLLSASVGATGCVGNDLANRANAVDPNPICPTVTCPVCSDGSLDAEAVAPSNCSTAVVNPNTLYAETGAWGMISGKGTGMALAESEVTSFLLAAFAQEGVPLVEATVFNKGGVQTELDGYNAGKAVGFEFISEERLDFQQPSSDSDPNEPSYDSDEPMNLSYAELQELRAMEEHGEAHILAIDALDSRFSTSGLTENSPQTKEAALYNLAKHVHAYLNFLRSQGVL